MLNPICLECGADYLHVGTVPESDVTVYWCESCEYEDAA